MQNNSFTIEAFFNKSNYVCTIILFWPFYVAKKNNSLDIQIYHVRLKHFQLLHFVIVIRVILV